MFCQLSRILLVMALLSVVGCGKEGSRSPDSGPLRADVPVQGLVKRSLSFKENFHN